MPNSSQPPPCEGQRQRRMQPMSRHHSLTHDDALAEDGTDLYRTPSRRAAAPGHGHGGSSSIHSNVSALTGDSLGGRGYQHQHEYGDGDSAHRPPRHPRSAAQGAHAGGAAAAAAAGGRPGAAAAASQHTVVDGIALPRMQPYTPSARSTARAAALSQAGTVLTSTGYGTDQQYLDSFNLLGVVSNPRAGAGIWGDVNAAISASDNHGHGSAHQHYHRRSTSGSLSLGGGGGGSSSRNGSPTKDGTSDTTTAASGHSTGAADVSSPPPATALSRADTPGGNVSLAATATSALSAATGLDMSTLQSVADLETAVTEGMHELSDTINTVNSYFSTISSYYLGSGILLPGAQDDFAGELEYEGLGDEAMSAQLAREDLRSELRDVNLKTVEAYLRNCGGLAQRFDGRRGESELINVGEREEVASSRSSSVEEESDDDSHGQGRDGGVDAVQGDGQVEASASPMTENEDAPAASDPTQSVPEIFFSYNFDLTDPNTFESLLVIDDNEDDLAAEHDNDDPTKPELMSLHPTESLSAHLDTIELALLNQVRSKSSSFFRETNRFSYLQNQVSECVSDVRDLRESFSTIKERTVTDVELIPIMDRKRRELRILGAVLDEVQDVVEVKGSVAGLIAAGDYVGAIYAIRNARSLLRGDKKNDENKSGTVSGVSADAKGDSNEEVKVDEKQEEEKKKLTPMERAVAEAAEAALDFPLSRLASMSKVDDQLNQYEELVVNDLANELVETFLSWEDASASGDASSLLSNSPFSLSGGVGRRSRTREVVKALALCRKLDYAADLYKTKLSEIVRVTVRTTVTESAADALAELERKKSKNISASATEGGAEQNPSQAKSSVTAGVTSMTFEQFLGCLDMLFDQILSLLKGGVAVTKFLREEGIVLKDEEPKKNEAKGEGQRNSNGTAETAVSKKVTKTTTALIAAADLSHKSISELLRLRKESHSLIAFDEMKRLWDTCLDFTLSIERFSGQKAYGLRSTLLTQAKAFVERRHEANMAGLVSALDGERWNQCDVSAERQAALERLCSGRAVLSGQSAGDTFDSVGSASTAVGSRSEVSKLAEADVEGKRYKVVWSCLLLVEMIMSNVACAAHFQTLATNVVSKVCELLRLFNSRTTQLVLGAGAIHSAARLKSINAKHLSLVTQCLGLVVTILPHVRAALMAQLPSKQHSLLVELDKIKKEYGEHNEKVLSKLVSIIGGIIERGLAPRIAKIDFDARASTMPTPTVHEIRSTTYENSVTCCQFLEGISTNARKMHQVLVVLLPPEDLVDVFSRIFAYVDTKVPALFLAAVAEGEKQTVTAAKAAAEAAAQRSQQGGTVVALPPQQPGPTFKMPRTEAGKLRMILEVDSMSRTLNRLPNVQPWDFTAVRILERELEFSCGINCGASAASEDILGAEMAQATEQTQQPQVHEVEVDSVVSQKTEGSLLEDRASASELNNSTLDANSETMRGGGANQAVDETFITKDAGEQSETHDGDHAVNGTQNVALASTTQEPAAAPESSVVDEEETARASDVKQATAATTEVLSPPETLSENGAPGPTLSKECQQGVQGPVS